VENAAFNEREEGDLSRIRAKREKKKKKKGSKAGA
jgi:hypothetical protein